MTPKPIAVWEANELSFMFRSEEKQAWLVERGVPLDLTYKVEFYAKPPFMRIFQFKEDSDSRKHCELQHDHPHETCKPAEHKPYDILLDSLPPDDLLRMPT